MQVLLFYGYMFQPNDSTHPSKDLPSPNWDINKSATRITSSIRPQQAAVTQQECIHTKIIHVNSPWYFYQQLPTRTHLRSGKGWYDCVSQFQAHLCQGYEKARCYRMMTCRWDYIPCSQVTALTPSWIWRDSYSDILMKYWNTSRIRIVKLLTTESSWSSLRTTISNG